LCPLATWRPHALTAIGENATIHAGAAVEHHAAIEPTAPLDGDRNDLLPTFPAVAAVVASTIGTTASACTHR